jgi:hypothetical protein
MKKFAFVFVLAVFCAALTAAEDYDSKVRAAVIRLTERLSSPIEVTLGTFYLDGTQSQSGLSRSLRTKIGNHAQDTGKLKVIVTEPPKAGETRAAKSDTASARRRGVIQGTFRQGDKEVFITLQLISDSDGALFGSSPEFAVPISELKNLGIEVLPANIKTDGEAKEKEERFIPPAAQPVSTLKIETWPDSDTNTYFVGDKMRIYLLASKDCFVRVDYTDAAGKMQLLFPNQYNTNNFLKANTVYIIPNAPVELVMEPPLGIEYVWVRVSTQPFANIEKEYAVVKNASSATINESRGGSLRLTTGGQSAETAETFFSITTLDASYFDESYSFKKPANMAEAIQSMRAEIISQGGTFNGNEREGTFTVGGMTGNYSVTGDQFTVKQRNTGNRFTQRSRGVGFSFSIDKPKNMSQAVQAVRSGITAKGGTFEGNEQQGNFRASGITGQYNVSDRVSVNINEKPALIPNSMIEKEVKNYFVGK